MKRRMIRAAALFLMLAVICVVGANPVSGGVQRTEDHGNTVDKEQDQQTEADMREDSGIWADQYRHEIQEIYLDDIAPESILCENLLADVNDGFENPEICRLYADMIAEHEAFCESLKDNKEGVVVRPFQIRYAVYDINGDALEDYIVLLGGSGYDESAGICADILLRKEDGEFIWVRMPVSRYNECPEGTAESEYFMMLVDSGNRKYPWFVFTARDGLKVYGWDQQGATGTSRYTESISCATMLQREEAGEGFRCRVTEVFTMSGASQWQHRAWIRVLEAPSERGISQIVTGECTPITDLDRSESLEFWDADDDGFLDILYYGGVTGGSGGSFVVCQVFRWNESSSGYEEYFFPPYNNVTGDYFDKENHRLYAVFQSGAANQYYRIYELKEGQYGPAKELHLQYVYDLMHDAEGNDIPMSRAIYKEWDEVIGETDITGLSWEETKRLLEEKYPEFTFWREG